MRLPISQNDRGRWVFPPVGCIKMNFDGALFNNGTRIGIGVIAHNEHGCCIVWVQQRINTPGSVPLAEALAARASIFLAAHFGWSSVIIEGDCAPLINKIASIEPDFLLEL
ncbi:UNVERIFIED_CONTAM: hypothetical protein Slati_0222900 [Sesamum latifolium]|uniref:RNase H type-1 domain-containing protein n=1 Tax=Sesamum latifolium TaxID=2727402 RepID=A0AAW2YC58_9LAMI